MDFGTFNAGNALMRGFQTGAAIEEMRRVRAAEEERANMLAQGMMPGDGGVMVPQVPVSVGGHTVPMSPTNALTFRQGQDDRAYEISRRPAVEAQDAATLGKTNAEIENIRAQAANNAAEAAGQMDDNQRRSVLSGLMTTYTGAKAAHEAGPDAWAGYLFSRGQEIRDELGVEWDQIGYDQGPVILGMLEGAVEGLRMASELPSSDLIGGRVPEAPADVRTVDALADRLGIQQGTPAYQDLVDRVVGAGGVTVNTGDSGPQVGTIPQGYQLSRTPEGGYRMEPIPGGPAAAEQEGVERAAEAAAAQEQQYGSIVFEDIGRVRDMLTGGRDQPVTGVSGAVAGMVPGSEAADARALVETIKANIGFDRLQAMRDASPTGGALGSVTERELATLQAVMGNLEFSQSREQLLQNLDRLEQVYSAIVDKAARTGDGTLVPRIGGAPDIGSMSYDDIAAFLEQNPNVDQATRRALADRVRALMGEN